MRNTGTSQKILLRAHRALKEWETEGLTLDDCLDRLREEDFAEKRAVSSLLFEYFRHKGMIDALIRKHAKKDSVNQDMRLLLACSLTQVFFQTGLAWQSAVNIAVDCGKFFRGPGGGAFINAMLRSVLRDPSVKRDAIEPSFPEELSARWRETFGEETARSIQGCYATNPPLSFRARRGLTVDEEVALRATRTEGLDWLGKFAFYTTEDPAAVIESPLLGDGVLYIQDPATALAFSLLPDDLETMRRVLDACAAPGGKTILLWDAAGGPQMKLTACDRSEARISLMNRNLRKAGVRARTVRADVVESPFSPESFDLILADVPCSNTGVMRRRPDSPWRFSARHLNELTVLQGKILDSLGALVKPGGVLIYSTCSIETEEDAMQVRSFLTRNASFEMRTERLLLPSSSHDGAYAALLRKKP